MTLRIVLPWPPAALSPNARVSRWARARATRDARLLARVGTLEANARRHEKPDAGAGPVGLLYEAWPPRRPGRRMDDDNFIASMKAYRDGIAAGLGADDAVFRLLPVVWHAEGHSSGMVAVTVGASDDGVASRSTSADSPGGGVTGR